MTTPSSGGAGTLAAAAAVTRLILIKLIPRQDMALNTAIGTGHVP